MVRALTVIGWIAVAVGACWAILMAAAGLGFGDGTLSIELLVFILPQLAILAGGIVLLVATKMLGRRAQ
jgi:hypothetical protein